MMTDTCGALRDVALLPFPYQGCVAPESAPITWISTEVVFANIPILFVCLIWPLQALFSRNWFWLASHIVFASFSILSHILTSWQKMFLDAIDSRELPVHHISTDIYKSKRKHVISFMLWPVPTSPHFSSPFSFTELIKGFVAPSYLVEKASTAVYLLDWLKTSLTFYSVIIFDGICWNTWLAARRSNRRQILEPCSQNCRWWTLNHLEMKRNVS